MRFLFIVCAALLLSSCRFFGGERIYGDGRIVSEMINTGSFKSLDISGVMKVFVSQGAESVKMETDRNIMEYVEIFTDGNTLVIRPKRGYNLRPSKAVIVHVSASAFENIDISGASEVVAENTLSINTMHLSSSGASKIHLKLEGDKLVTDLSGASKLNIAGEVRDFDLGASGASDINCYGLVTETASISMSGASNAEITVNKELHAGLSGASHVRYKGNARVDKSTSGASSVSKEG